jgi:hypothetical protein
VPLIEKLVHIFGTEFAVVFDLAFGRRIFIV